MPSGGTTSGAARDTGSAGHAAAVRAAATCWCSRPPPLQEDIEVTGTVMVKLWVSLDRAGHRLHRQADRRVSAQPRLPARARPEHRRLDRPRPLSRLAGEGREAADDARRGRVRPIELYPTSHVFTKGHRIRVDISSSNFPRFDVNPNTGEPLNQNRRMENRRQLGVPRCAASVADHPADHSRRGRRVNKWGLARSGRKQRSCAAHGAETAAF